MRLSLFLCLAIFLASCTSDHSTFPISGKIVHNQNTTGNLNSDFNFTEHSFALITLTQINTEEKEEIVYEKRIENLDTFPVEFTLDPEIELSQKGSFSIKAEVFSQERNVLFVGDLVSLNSYTITADTDHLVIEVFGVEHCGSENADEVCTTRNEISANCGSVAGQSFQGPPDPPQCLGGEGCGSEGSVGFSDNSEDASFNPVNSDAISLLSYSQENSSVKLFYDTNPDSIQFNLINNCREIQYSQSGDVYRLQSHSWEHVLH